jgi:hypothetical protein
MSYLPSPVKPIRAFAVATTVVFAGWFVIEVAWVGLGLRLINAAEDRAAYRAHYLPYQYAAELKLYEQSGWRIRLDAVTGPRRISRRGTQQP